jgi:NAD(P)-dependent dehydrogenase (short-subunit alcohol dehydrogenase family)
MVADLQPPAGSSLPAPSAPPDADARSVLITGSSSGIGRATAERFAARGWRVYASMRRPEAGGDLRARAAERGWRLVTPALDVTRDDSVSGAVEAILAETGGRLDVLVNNAGYYAFGPLEQTTPDELRAQLETNVVGVHRVTRAVLPAMRARHAGTVVTIGSISGRVAVPMVGPYHASKWALEGMMEAWRLELIPFGVRVALVEPGPFKTGLHVSEKLAAATRPAGAAGAPAEEGGPYGEILASYRRQSARLRRSDDLGPVVDVIERAATARNPRLRWPVGPTSFTAGRLRAFVPDRLYEWVMRLAFPLRERRSRSGSGRAL